MLLRCHQRLRLMVAFCSATLSVLACCLMVQDSWWSFSPHICIPGSKMGEGGEASQNVLWIRKAKAFPEASSRLPPLLIGYTKYKGVWRNSSLGFRASTVKGTKERGMRMKAAFVHQQWLLCTLSKEERKKWSELSFTQTGHSEISPSQGGPCLDLFDPREPL